MTTLIPRPLGRTPKMTNGAPRSREHRAELTWLGNGAWCARDTRVPTDDARCVIAYVECVDDRVEVMWIHTRRPLSTFRSLRDAYTALNESLS